MGEMAFHSNEFARGDQLIGIGDGSSVEMDHGSGLKDIGFLCQIDSGIDAFHLLYEGILQQTVIEAIGFLLPIHSIHGGVAQL